MTGLVVFFLLRVIDPADVLLNFQRIELKWVLYAFMAQIATNVLWAYRWRGILSPVGRVGLLNAFSASMIGMMVNNFVPLRMGELARAVVLARREKPRKTEIVSSIFAEKIIESLSLLLIAAAVYPFMLSGAGGTAQAGILQSMRKIIAVFIFANVAAVAAIAGMFWAYENKPSFASSLLNSLPLRWVEAIKPRLHRFYEGITIFKNPRQMGIITTVSLIYWMFVAMRITFIAKAFGVELPHAGAILVLLCILLSISVSIVPGHVGIHHAGSTAGFMLLGIDLSAAVSMSVIVHAVPFLATTAIGMLCMWREHLQPGALAAMVEEKTDEEARAQ